MLFAAPGWVAAPVPPEDRAMAGLKVCAAVHALECAGLRLAITAPVVGEIVNEPSLLLTEVTSPPGASPLSLITVGELNAGRLPGVTGPITVTGCAATSVAANSSAAIRYKIRANIF